MLLPTHEEHLNSQFQVSNSKTVTCRSWTLAAPGAGRQAPDNSHGSTYENFNYSKERLRAYSAGRGAYLLPKSLRDGLWPSLRDLKKSGPLGTNNLFFVPGGLRSTGNMIWSTGDMVHQGLSPPGIWSTEAPNR